MRMIRTRTLVRSALVALVLVACDRNPFEPSHQPISYIAVEAGGSHSCGLAIGGVAYCWGRGGNGQLGDGRTASSADPVRVGDQGHVFTSITLGQHHTCGVATDGRAYCWGWNRWGQLGVGSTADFGLPDPVAGGLSFAQLSAGFYHTCGLTPTGEAWCWGDNAQGQLGTGGNDQGIVPARVAGDLVFGEISAGGFHTCGLTADGRAYCWGLNYLGQLGVGDAVNRTVPVAVAGDRRFTRIAAGGMHSCAVDADGQAHCWGSARHGELGTGHVTPVHTPDAPVASPHAVHQERHDGRIVMREIDAGLHFTCATDTRRRAWCWGLGYDGQLGGNELAVLAIPRQVFATNDIQFTGISAGPGTHACAITDAFGAFCWGSSPEGGLGPETTFSAQPVRIPGPR